MIDLGRNNRVYGSAPIEERFEISQLQTKH
jgi:hypothetical protein